jgi:hypothetical protein
VHKEEVDKPRYRIATVKPNHFLNGYVIKNITLNWKYQEIKNTLSIIMYKNNFLLSTAGRKTIINTYRVEMQMLGSQ